MTQARASSEILRQRAGPNPYLPARHPERGNFLRLNPPAHGARMHVEERGDFIDAQARFFEQEIGIVEGSGLPAWHGHRAGQSTSSPLAPSMRRRGHRLQNDVSWTKFTHHKCPFNSA